MMAACNEEDSTGRLVVEGVDQEAAPHAGIVERARTNLVDPSKV